MRGESSEIKLDEECFNDGKKWTCIKIKYHKLLVPLVFVAASYCSIASAFFLMARQLIIGFKASDLNKISFEFDEMVF